MSPRKKIDPDLPARISRLEEELSALKAAAVGAQLDDIRAGAGPYGVVTFGIGGDVFALPLWSVRGVSRAVAIDEPAPPPPGVVGYINYHGDIAPVLERADLLGVERRPINVNDQVIYFSAPGGTCALVTDVVIDVEIIPPERFVTASAAGLSRSYYAGAFDRGGKLIPIIEPALISLGTSFKGPTETAL